MEQKLTKKILLDALQSTDKEVALEAQKRFARELYYPCPLVTPLDIPKDNRRIFGEIENILITDCSQKAMRFFEICHEAREISSEFGNIMHAAMVAESEDFRNQCYEKLSKFELSKEEDPEAVMLLIEWAESVPWFAKLAWDRLLLCDKNEVKVGAYLNCGFACYNSFDAIIADKYLFSCWKYWVLKTNDYLSNQEFEKVVRYFLSASVSWCERRKMEIYLLRMTKCAFEADNYDSTRRFLAVVNQYKDALPYDTFLKMVKIIFEKSSPCQFDVDVLVGRLALVVREKPKSADYVLELLNLCREKNYEEVLRVTVSIIRILLKADLSLKAYIAFLQWLLAYPFEVPKSCMRLTMHLIIGLKGRVPDFSRIRLGLLLCKNWKCLLAECYRMEFSGFVPYLKHIKVDADNFLFELAGLPFQQNILEMLLPRIKKSWEDADVRISVKEQFASSCWGQVFEVARIIADNPLQAEREELLALLRG